MSDANDNPLSDDNVETMSELLLDDSPSPVEESADIEADVPPVFGGHEESSQHGESRSEPEADEELDFEGEAKEAVTEQSQSQTYRAEQAIRQQADELQEAIGQLQQMVQTNEISQEQYAQAMSRAQSQYNQLHGEDIARREELMSQHRQQETNANIVNQQIAAEIPAWAEPNNRQKIIEQVTNYVMDAFGVSKEQVNSINDPMIMVQMYKTMKKGHAARNNKLEQIKRNSKPKPKRRAKKADTSYKSGREDQINSIAKLLGG